MLPAGATRVRARPASSASPAPGPGEVDEGSEIHVPGLHPALDIGGERGEGHHLLGDPAGWVLADLRSALGPAPPDWPPAR